MIRSRSGGILSLFLKPLLILLVIVAMFGLVRLRSAVVAVNYEIRNLEEKKAEGLKNMKLLLAERSKYASLENLAASFSESAVNTKGGPGGENLFGNRIRVIHIRRGAGPQPYRASLQSGNAK